MKSLTLFIILSLCTLTGLMAQPAWQSIEVPTGENLTSVYFHNSENGWITSENGTILKSTDGGQNWENVFTGAAIHISAVCFSDNDHGCAVGWYETEPDSSMILLTEDAGESWVFIDHYFVTRLNDVFFINNNIGWAVGVWDNLDLNCCLYTSDGGFSWDIQSSISIAGAELLSVSFRNENEGSVCGANGAFFITNSGGNSGWAMGISMPLINLNDIYNFGDLTGCIVGENGTALYTINNWYQYINQITNTSENLNAVSGALGNTDLWAVGDNGTIIFSSYYLFEWDIINSGVTENLNDVHMLSDSDGWAVGDNGTVLHYTEETGITESKISEGNDIVIFPNPATENIVITLPENTILNTLQVIDLNAEMVIDLNLNSFFNRLELDISDLNTGVYLVELHTDQEVTIKKLVID